MKNCVSLAINFKQFYYDLFTTDIPDIFYLHFVPYYILLVYFIVYFLMQNKSNGKKNTTNLGIPVFDITVSFYVYVLKDSMFKSLRKKKKKSAQQNFQKNSNKLKKSIPNHFLFTKGFVLIINISSVYYNLYTEVGS